MNSGDNRFQNSMQQQAVVLQQLSAGAPVTDVLHLILESIESQFPGVLSVISLLSKDGRSLSVAAERNFPVNFKKVIEQNGFLVGLQTTPCGESAQRKLPVLISDIENDPYWHHLLQAFEADGLQACWSFPLCDSKNRLVGTIALYHRAPASLSEEERNLLRMYGTAIGLIIEKYDLDGQVDCALYFDELTGLPNRKYFVEQVDGLLGKSKNPFAVLKMCLEEFQWISDGLGYKVADKVLEHMSCLLRTCVFEEAAIIARTGAHEFAVLLLRENAADAREMANCLLNAVDKPFEYEHLKLHLTASVGIAMSHSDGDDVEALLQNADLAMHYARKSGGNQFTFYEKTLTEDMAHRVAVTTELTAAIERDEFSLYYQPHVHIESGILSAEALVRWNHPRHGLVLPGEFIPLAEITGQIVPLGWLVLHKACRQLREWMDNGIEPIRISINISASQFGPELIARLERSLQEYCIDPKWIEIEITERVFMKQEKTSHETLAALKRMGVVVSLDDFGTGYSSFGFLQHFQVDAVKIDQSFVQNTTQDDRAAAIVSTIIDLCKKLGLRIIAEGVETEEQVHFLKEQGCQKMQGFFFYEPLPPEEFQRLLVSQSTSRQHRTENRLVESV